MNNIENKSEQQLPSDSSLLNLLSDYRGRRAYIVPMENARRRPLGNNGDKLMSRVFQRRIRQLDLKPAPLSEAEVVIVPPNGALLDTYRFPSLLTATIKNATGIPLVIFPSSAYFRTKSPAKMFEGRSADVLWVLREPRSFLHLRSTWGQSLADLGVRLALDHDVVAAEGGRIRQHFPSCLKADYVLVAARLDSESRFYRPSITQASPTLGLKLLAKRAWHAAPHLGIKTKINRNIARAALKKSGFALEERARQNAAGVFGSDLWERPFIYLDVSSPKFCSFFEYGELIANSSAVISDRLHVAMPAGLLGKPTIMMEGGYHKLKGVYEHSLQKVASIRFVP